MSDVYGGIAFFSCMIVWLILGGYSFGKAMASGDVKKDYIGAMFWFCLLLAPFAFGYSFVADAQDKKKDAKSTT